MSEGREVNESGFVQRLLQIVSEQLRQYFHLWDLAPQMDKAVLIANHTLARLYCKEFACWHVTKARGQVVLVLLGLLCWLPFTSSVMATVLALIWYGLAGRAKSRSRVT